MSQRLPRQGDPVLYRPRVPYGRQSELTGLITRIWNAESGDIDLVTFPANSEMQHMSHVARASDTITIHCWDFVDDPRVSALIAELSELRRDLDALKPGAPAKGQRARERDLVS